MYRVDLGELKLPKVRDKEHYARLMRQIFRLHEEMWGVAMTQGYVPKDAVQAMMRDLTTLGLNQREINTVLGRTKFLVEMEVPGAWPRT
jgi:hypothetical protein